MGTLPADRDRVNISKILLTSWDLYRRNFLLFIGISAAGNTFNLIATARQLIFGNAFAWTEFLTAPLGLFFPIWSAVALIIATSERFQGQPISFTESFRKVKGRFWRYIGFYLLYLLIFVVGLMLFIIPGFYWETIFSLSIVVAVLEGKDKRPFKVSKELVSGYFWKVFWLGVVVSLISWLTSFVTWRLFHFNMTSAVLLWNQLVLIFFGPFWTIVSVILYHQLVKAKQSAGILTVQTSGKPNGCLIALGLSIAIIVLSIFWAQGLAGFFKSDSGSRFWQSIKEPIRQNFFSPKIVYPGNVTFKNPEGWWAIGGAYEDEPRYFFFRHAPDKLHSFQLWTLPLTRKDGSKVKDSEIAEWIIDKTFKVSFYERLYRGLERRPAEQITIDGNVWGTLELTNKDADQLGRITIYGYFYKSMRDYALIFSYSAHYKSLTDPRYESDKSEMSQIIKQMIQ